MTQEEKKIYNRLIKFEFGRDANLYDDLFIEKNGNVIGTFNLNSWNDVHRLYEKIKNIKFEYKDYVIFKYHKSKIENGILFSNVEYCLNLIADFVDFINKFEYIKND